MRENKRVQRHKMFLLFIYQSAIKWTINTKANMIRLYKWEDLFYQAYDDLDNDVIAIQGEEYIKCKRFIKNIISQREDNNIRGMKASCIIVDDLYRDSFK